MESIDKFALQTHVNDLARRYSQDRVKQARSYLKSIFDEAIEQEFLVKDPTRKLKIPKNLRPKDKQVLTWDQLRAVLATAARRDRLLLMLDMTDALRPSELFALRWLSFDDENTLSLTETVYRRQLTAVRQDHEELGQGSSTGWPRRRSSSNGNGSAPIRLPKAFMFPNADGGLLDPGNYRNRVLKPLAEALELPKLTFQVLRRTMATRAHRIWDQ